jgi:hypothetical protein
MNYVLWLDQSNKAITSVLKSLDFSYLYNGILQHSGPRYSKRYVLDYTSGEFNYVLCKHVAVLKFIAHLLAPYHQLISVLTFPRMGRL